MPQFHPDRLDGAAKNRNPEGSRAETTIKPILSCVSASGGLSKLE